MRSLRKNLGTKPPLFPPFIRSLFIRGMLFAALGVLVLIASKAPLRLIVDRQLETQQRGCSTLTLTDLMECGHTAISFVDIRDVLNAYTEDASLRARRHRCRECQSIAAAKKPVRSVSLTLAKEGLA
jgi:hypothetical protein